MATATKERTQMHRTKNDLDKGTREKVNAILTTNLANLTDLFTQTKHAHWNVKGPRFIALHELFDQVANAVRGHVDTIAERITQLGGTAHGTARMVAERTELPEYPADIFEGMQHVDALSTALAATAKSTRQAIDDTEELSDMVTSDIFIAITGDLDKWLWFVEAHQQADE